VVKGTRYANVSRRGKKNAGRISSRVPLEGAETKSGKSKDAWQYEEGRFKTVKELLPLLRGRRSEEVLRRC